MISKISFLSLAIFFMGFTGSAYAADTGVTYGSVQGASIIDSFLGLMPDGARDAYQGLPQAVRGPLDSVLNALEGLMTSQDKTMGEVSTESVSTYVNTFIDKIKNPENIIPWLIGFVREQIEYIKGYLKI